MMSYLFIFAIVFLIIYYYHLSYTRLLDELRDIRIKCIPNSESSTSTTTKYNVNNYMTQKFINNPFVSAISYILDFLNNRIKSLE